ncbi:MAG TPA: response regulator transcription factor [Thermomicrobiales bacterium]|jgi:two-component system response regulator MprA|nr:response regulator transcription factor [Thermomicrobiales bacterium]
MASAFEARSDEVGLMAGTEAERFDGAAILVVEDEPGIAGFVRRGLTFEGFAVRLATDGRAALATLLDERPDLLVLDLMLPHVDGLEILRRLRAAERDERLPRLPVILLTARDAVTDRVGGLEAGADDYLVKPFAFEELVARVRALLRRATEQKDAVPAGLSYADLHLDPSSRAVRRGERSIELTPREFNLLALLLDHPNQVLTRSRIMERVWGADFYGDSNVLEVFVGNLRRHLEAEGEPRLIQTVRGVGYVLRAQG